MGSRARQLVAGSSAAEGGKRVASSSPPRACMPHPTVRAASHHRARPGAPGGERKNSRIETTLRVTTYWKERGGPGPRRGGRRLG